MRRFALLPALALVALSACDTNDADAPPSLVGTWTMADKTTASLATPSRDVQAIDARVPGTGEIRYAGTATGALRYGRDFTPYIDRYNAGASIARYSVTSMPGMGVGWVGLSYTDSGALSLSLTQDGVSRTYSATVPVGTFAYANGRMTVQPTTLTAPSGATVQVEGTLAPVMLELRAGVETEIARVTSPLVEGVHQELTFSDDGTFQMAWRYAEDDSVRQGSSVGRWTSLADGAAQLTVETPDGPKVIPVEVRIEDGRLAWRIRNDLCSTNCKAYEVNHLLPAASLAKLRIVTSQYYDRTR